MTIGKKEDTPLRVGSLASIHAIMNEMRRVYRETRRDELDLQKAKSLTYMLNLLAGLQNSCNLEERIRKLEAEINARHTKSSAAG